MADVAQMDFADRLGAVFEKTLPRLGPKAREQLAQLIEPESLAIIAGVLVAWIVGHAFGVGEVVDIILLVVGAFSIGFAIFTGIDELYDFAKRTYTARSDNDLDTASSHLAKAIAILGIEAVLAVLFRGRPRGRRMNVGTPPPRGPGWRYRPKTDMHADLRPGNHGSTNAWGDIKISRHSTPQVRDIALLHEQVHRFLTAKFYPLRVYRVENRFGSYFNTSLYRYFEEALAQTIALVGRAGFARVFEGIGFPVRNGYVYLTRGGGYNPLMKGSGLLPEFASLIGAGTAHGYAYQLWFAPGERPPP